MQELVKMVKSMMGGGTAAIIFVSTSYVLDKIMNAKLSSALALLVGAICNFYMQQRAFLNTSKADMKFGRRYICLEIIILGCCLFGVNMLLDRKKEIQSAVTMNTETLEKFDKYYNTMVRIIVAMIVFVVISFPVRRYWVFTTK